MALETPSGSYDRAVVISTPHSSRPGTWAGQIAALPLPQVPIVAERQKDVSLEDDVHRLWDTMYDTLETGDLLVVPSGDGFQHHVVNGLLQDHFVAAGFNKLAFCPVPEGNACDLRAQIAGDDSLETVLREGSAIDLRPLKAEITHQVSPDIVKYALGYFSLDGTAVASERYEEMKHSNNPLLKLDWMRHLLEVPVTAKAVAKAPRVIFAEDGKFRTGRDRVFIRGSRIAKYGHPHADLAVDAFEDITSSPDSRLDVLASMIRLQRGTLYDKIYGHELRKLADFIVRLEKKTDDPEPMLDAQCDGEHFRIRSGSRVRVSIADRMYRTITTRLRRPDVAIQQAA